MVRFTVEPQLSELGPEKAKEAFTMLIPLARGGRALLLALVTSGLCWTLAPAAFAQDDGAEAEDTGQERIGLDEEEAQSSSVRLAFQGRLTAVNVVLAGALAVDGRDGLGAANQVPLATPGLRLLEGRLFAGLGFGFFGVEGFNSGLSFSPTVSVDVVRDADLGAFYITGWFTLGSFDGAAARGTDGDLFGWGFSAMAGARAILTRALSLGAEMGWGFLSLNQDGGSSFFHSMAGSLILEASLGV